MKPRTMKQFVEKCGGGCPGSMTFVSWIDPVIFPPRRVIITRSSKTGRGRKRQYRKIRRGKQ